MAVQDNQLLDFILFDGEVVAGNIPKKSGAPAYPANQNKVLDRTDYETYVDLDFSSLDADSFSDGKIPNFGKAKEHKVSASWNANITSAVYANKSLAVAAQDNNPLGIAFSGDGVNFYVAGATTDAIKQYTCSTPWDISTASFLQSYSVAAQEATVTAVLFSPDGTKMFTHGFAGDSVEQYTLSTAWNISTASFDNVSIYTFLKDSNMWDIRFNNDGTKLYCFGDATDTIYSYTCPTPWDITGATDDLTSFAFTANQTALKSGFFNPDGTKLYTTGVVPLGIQSWSLSTGFDLSTITYDSAIFDVTTQDSNPDTVIFSDDGTKMYVLGRANDTVYQYDVTVS